MAEDSNQQKPKPESPAPPADAPPFAVRTSKAAVKPDAAAAPVKIEGAVKPSAPPPEKKHGAKSLKPETPTPGALVVEESIEIAAPPEKVWKVFTAEEKWPQWNPVIKSARHVNGKHWTMGWQFEFVIKNPPLPPLKVSPIVLEVSVPNMVRWVGAAPGLCGMHWFLFESSETGTRATSYEEFSGMLTPLLRLFRRSTARTMRRWLQALKEECEKAVGSKPHHAVSG